MKKEIIKSGGCYKTKDGGWIIITTYSDKNHRVCHLCYNDEDGYDEEIRDMTDDQIREIADLSVCYVPYYRKGKGLYKVWDKLQPKSKAIII